LTFGFHLTFWIFYSCCRKSR